MYTVFYTAIYVHSTHAIDHRNDDVSSKEVEEIAKRNATRS